MSCPHGFNSHPATCSQCLGVKVERVKPRVIDVDEMVHYDDVFGAERRSRGTTNSAGRVRHCARCGQDGHDRRSPCAGSN